jgi:hypothetical protein
LASAYTPGLTVSGDITVLRTRRLPIKGEVLVKPGDRVTPETPVARALLPGVLQTLRLAEKLGIEAKEVPGMFRLKAGDSIEKGQVVAETKGFLGKFKTTVLAETTGTVESVSEITGNILIREAPTPIEIAAYIQGQVASIIPNEGAIVESRCALVQGIFGIGGERTGKVRVAVKSADEVLEASHILASDAGNILIGGAGLTGEALQKATEVGVKGLIAGGMKDSDLIKFLGYDIGVAITGTENINITVLVTEGFGFLSMAGRTFELLKTLEGKTASINGATQIRAGVIRPELIVPLPEDLARSNVAVEAHELLVGAAIRVIREPYFGQLGTVTELPAQLMVVDSGTEVRVLKAKLASGEIATVPRANVEIMASD